MKFNNLKLLLQEGEGLTLEFKERYTPRIVEDIVAFSNSKGGILLLGVNDKGSITGETLNNRLRAEINSLARNCEPTITIKNIRQIGEIIAIEISGGEEKPYCCSSGYFKRLDAVTQKMSQKEIKLMFTQSSVSPFEEKIFKDINWKDISKEKIRSFFNEANIPIKNISSRNVLKSLNLSKNDKIRNIAILFFAKNPRQYIPQTQMTLIAFKGTDRVHIYDRIDIYDDLLSQFNAAMTFLKKHLSVSSIIKGINREEIYEIPMNALREAIANAIIHRDYSIRGTSLTIEIYEDRVDITNPGGLPEGINLHSLGNVSIRRNELIADMFYRLKKVEKVGTGIKRMKEILRNAKLPLPKIQSNSFFVISFKRNKSGRLNGGLIGGLIGGLNESLHIILSNIKQNPGIKAKDIANLIKRPIDTVDKQIKQLKKKGFIERRGSKKAGGYYLKEKN